MTMLLDRNTALAEIFRAQAAQTKREIRFYLKSERTFERHEIEEQRQKEERAELERMEQASVEQMAAFRGRLDHYDTATVEALMENGEALDRAREKREAIEQDAYRLADGRLVFKTGDGRRVVDQGGQDVPSSVIDPNQVPNRHPKAEAYLDALGKERKLETERGELLKYQEKLDHARDRLDQGKISAKELDTLGDDLERSMPDAVRRKVDPQALSHDPDAPLPGAMPQAAPAAARSAQSNRSAGRWFVQGPQAGRARSRPDATPDVVM